MRPPLRVQLWIRESCAGQCVLLGLGEALRLGCIWRLFFPHSSPAGVTCEPSVTPLSPLRVGSTETATPNGPLLHQLHQRKASARTPFDMCVVYMHLSVRIQHANASVHDSDEAHVVSSGEGVSRHACTHKVKPYSSKLCAQTSVVETPYSGRG